MPKKNSIEEILGSTVAEINKRTNATLSYKKIHSDIKRIMAAPEAQRADLLAEYCKTLSKSIFDTVSEKRSYLNSVENISRYDMENFLKYPMSAATECAKRIAKAGVQVIDPEYAAKFAFSPKHLEDIRDWEKSQIRAHTIYEENARIFKYWTAEFVEEQKHLCVSQFYINKQDRGANETFTFSGKFDHPSMDSVADLYSKVKLVRDELAKHGRIWRWFHSKQVEMYNDYLTMANATLKRIGFDESKHGEMTLARAKQAIFFTYATDIDTANSAYNAEMEKLKPKAVTVESTVARERYNKGKELDNDPKTAFAGKIQHILDKRGMTMKDFNLHRVDWQDCMEGYDKNGKLGDVKENAQGMFMACIKDMLSHASQNGKTIDIPEILKDARDITVASMQHYTIVYSKDDIKNLAEPLYLDGVDAGEMKNYMNRFLKNEPSQELKDKLSAEAADVIEEWRKDLEKVKSEDMALAVKCGEPIAEAKQSEKESMSVDLCDKDENKELSAKVNEDSAKTLDAIAK